MTSLLHLSVSPRIDQSYSRLVGHQYVQQLISRNPALHLVRRDLGLTPPPHPSTAFMTASLKRETDRTSADRQELVYSETLLGELAEASMVVIDTPMHNFTLPSALKAWIDYVVRPGCSFEITPLGKIPLLRDRPVRVIVACGGGFSGQGAQRDFLSPYLRYVFATIGLQDLDFLILERVTRGAAERAAAAERATQWISAQLRSVPL